MYPATYNMKMKQGSVFTRKITVKNKNTGVLTDFTGYTARMDIKSEINSSILISLSTANGGIVLSSQGGIELKITSAQSKKLTLEKCIYDLDLISPSGEVYTYLEGTIFVSLGVTL